MKYPQGLDFQEKVDYIWGNGIFTDPMKISHRFIWIIAAGIWLYVSPDLAAQQEKYRYSETYRLVDVVNDAATLINQSGKSAFPSFMKKGSRWRSGEMYIFVIDLKGNCFAHEDPSLVGKNLSDLKDPNGKPIIQWFIRKALSQGQSGWTQYRWVRPGDSIPSWKTTYTRLAKSPAGNIYIVGAGLYDMKMEKAFAVEAVDDALILIRQMGKKAFPLLRDSTSEFVYKDTYIFVVDSTYTVLVDLPFPDEEGKNVYDYHDIKGKYFFREFFKTVNEKGSGWVEYFWPRPGETRPSPKTSYVKKIVVRGETFLVGTGIYLD